MENTTPNNQHKLVIVWNADHTISSIEVQGSPLDLVISHGGKEILKVGSRDSSPGPTANTQEQTEWVKFSSSPTRHHVSRLSPEQRVKGIKAIRDACWQDGATINLVNASNKVDRCHHEQQDVKCSSPAYALLLIDALIRLGFKAELGMTVSTMEHKKAEAFSSARK